MQIIKLENVGRKFQRYMDNSHIKSKEGIFVTESSDSWFWALRNIYMSINKSEIVGIIGRNGSGKTTLLNIIAGRLPVSEGEVVTHEKISALLSLGAGFQDEFSGRENIYLNGSLLGMKRDQIDAAFGDIVDFSELGDFINAPLGSYSAGMKLRLAFSVAIHVDFNVLLTDEVIKVGDVSFQKKCFEKMVDFKRLGKSMIIVAHDMPTIERFCDKVFLLEDGRIISSGPAKTVVEQYEMLLSKKKVLSESTSAMVTETKRWASDMQDWGKREGTKEAIITDLVILNKWKREVKKIKCGDRAIIRVYFKVQEEIEDCHFGLAIFREDGVYCYGPNTQFDGLAVGCIKKGDDKYFDLDLEHFSFMSGVYCLSAAIWDKNEMFAYDYHKGKYKLEVVGSKSNGELASLEQRWKNPSFFSKIGEKHFPDLGFLADKQGACFNSESVNFNALVILNCYGYNDNVFATGRDIKLTVDYKINKPVDKSLVLWIGIFRSDNIYCCSGMKKIVDFDRTSETLLFPRLALLPGGYSISVGFWSVDAQKFISYSHGRHLFNVISDRRDHGTVYLEHSWRWKA